MGVKVATSSSLHWTHTNIHHHPFSSYSPSQQAPASSSISSSSSKRTLLECRYVHRWALFGTKLYRSKASEYPKQSKHTIKRTCSSNFDNAFSHEEFSKKLQDSDDGVNNNNRADYFMENQIENSYNLREENLFDRGYGLDWPRGDEIIPDNILRKANSVELPLSIRIIKRRKKNKKQWEESEAGDSGNCCVKKAFSSMVFMIRELHSYTLQMREYLFYEDLRGIVARVHKEMHASFVWLFQQVFSPTPTLMVYLMILLANFTVYSLGNNAGIRDSYAPAESIVSIMDTAQNENFDSSIIKTFSVSSFNGKTASVGGNNGGGGKFPSVASGMDGGDRFDRHKNQRTIIDGSAASQLSSEEMRLWNSIVEEAGRMQGALRDESLDHDTIQRFVSPAGKVEIQEDDYADYFRTELLYQMGLTQDPNNALLLANYAQFLYLVAHDYDRAEEYFKKATTVKPPDGEAYNKYATFLWLVRKDLWAAEETYLEAISADPGNTFYAANYAHFLWNTGGEDTCFPLDSSDESNTQDI